MKIVIAGNYNEFCNWCAETKTSPREVIYVSDVGRIKGYRVKLDDIVKYGTYSERKDFEEIMEELQWITVKP